MHLKSNASHTASSDRPADYDYASIVTEGIHMAKYRKRELYSWQKDPNVRRENEEPEIDLEDEVEELDEFDKLL